LFDVKNIERFYGLILFSEKMAASIREEIRRLHRRKQLNFYPGHEVHCNQESSSDGAMDSPGSPTTSSFATTYSSNTKEKPLFTFRQVTNNFSGEVILRSLLSSGLQS
jgi:hypothetical protein